MFNAINPRMAIPIHYNAINPRMAIPIHYNDYDVFKSPLEDFQKEIEKAGLDNRIYYLTHGETYSFKL